VARRDHFTPPPLPYGFPPSTLNVDIWFGLPGELRHDAGSTTLIAQATVDRDRVP
jgi:hypothetical protein